MKNFLFVLAIFGLTAFMPAKKVKIFMAGDSTMANKKPDRYPETGWGQVFSKYFDENVKVSNQAVNGRSTKSFLAENRWQRLVDQLSEGDYVFIQFGHNDSKIDRPDRGATLEEYETNLKLFVKDAKGKKAIPVLVTPVMRRSIKNGKFFDSHGGYPAVVRKVAAEENVPLIDLLEESKKLLERTGQEESKKFYLYADSAVLVNYPKGIKDATHFSEEGANVIAGLVANCIKTLKLPLAGHLKQQ